MSLPKVIVFHSQKSNGADIEELSLSRYGIDVIYADSNLLSSDLDEASVVICPSIYELSREVQVRLEGKLVVCVMSQDPQLDFDMGRHLNARDVLHVERSAAAEIADSVLTLMLSFLRRLPLPSTSFANHPPACSLDGVRRLQHLVVGLWGWDRTARLVARRCLGFDMRVRVHDPGLDLSDMGDSARRVPLLPEVEVVSDLGSFLRMCHVISVHPGTAAASNHLGEGGPLVTEDAVDALSHGTVLLALDPSTRVDDLAVKHGLNSGRIGALAVVAGPGQWDEAWVRDMAHVQVVPSRAVTYSDQGLATARYRACTIAAEFLALTNQIDAAELRRDGRSSQAAAARGVAGPQLSRIGSSGAASEQDSDSASVSPKGARHQGPNGLSARNAQAAAAASGPPNPSTKKKKRGGSVARAKTALRQAEARIGILETLMQRAGLSVPTVAPMAGIQEGEEGGEGGDGDGYGGEEDDRGGDEFAG